MNLYNLGKAPWQESQLIYHALARLGRESLVLVSPARPYVCVGYFQGLDQEVDLAFCQQHHIPIFRREVGGGTVYLDGDQLFYQVIIHRDNPVVPVRKEAFYRKFLEPVVNTYRRIGIPAEYKPVNDVVVNANIIVDFNYAMMSRILKVPDEKFRDKVHKTMEENLTTIRRELSEAKASRWDEANLNHIMAEEFEKLLGPLTPRERDEELQAKMDDLASWMLSHDWLYRKGKKKKTLGREVKIRAGVKVIEKMHKAPGGLIRANFEVREGRFAEMSISGDFFCYPSDGVSRLESMLDGRPVEDARQVLSDLYETGET
ncbi:MAG: hypothetical protein JRI34_11485, partial [Deltaproteobacteria bacterium]|nr:hypothetical protein [Deltaproteobacteria bacterium]